MKLYLAKYYGEYSSYKKYIVANDMENAMKRAKKREDKGRVGELFSIKFVSGQVLMDDEK